MVIIWRRNNAAVAQQCHVHVRISIAKQPKMIRVSCRAEWILDKVLLIATMFLCALGQTNTDRPCVANKTQGSNNEKIRQQKLKPFLFPRIRLAFFAVLCVVPHNHNHLTAYAVQLNLVFLSFSLSLCVTWCTAHTVPVE